MSFFVVVEMNSYIFRSQDESIEDENVSKVSREDMVQVAEKRRRTETVSSEESDSSPDEVNR